MSKKKPDNVKRITFGGNVDEDLVWELKDIAHYERRNVYLVLEEAIREYVEKKKKKAPIKK